VSGVEFPDIIEKENVPLTLNGLGVRYKWFVKVYAAALYLPQRSDQAEDVLQSDEVKQIRMHFLYKKVSKQKLLATLEKGFQDNLSAKELEDLSDHIEQLRALFKTAYKGDEVILNYVPNSGTEIIFNGESQGVIPGLEFHQAILRVWLGAKPADKKLKERLLGIEKG
jgi:hypothetical protein